MRSFGIASLPIYTCENAKIFHQCFCSIREFANKEVITSWALGFRSELLWLPSWTTSFLQLKKFKMENCPKLNNFLVLDALWKLRWCLILNRSLITNLAQSFTCANAFLLLECFLLPRANSCSCIFAVEGAYNAQVNNIEFENFAWALKDCLSLWMSLRNWASLDLQQEVTIYVAWTSRTLIIRGNWYWMWKVVRPQKKH